MNPLFEHGPHQYVIVMDHDGEVQLGGCPLCCMDDPKGLAATLREAAEFVERNPKGRRQ